MPFTSRRKPSRLARRVARCPALVASLVLCASLASCSEPDSVDSIEGVRQLQEAGDFEASLAPLRKLVAEHPDDPELNFMYGRALVQTQRQDLALWSLRKAMEDPRWLVPAGTQLAYTALASQDFNEVVEITTEILEHEPENTGALLMRANAQAHWKKDPELALADANRVLELDPDKIEAYEPRILALLALDRFDEATESLAEAGRRLTELGASEDVLAWHCSTTAAFQHEAGDMERVRQTWDACLEKYPGHMGLVSSAVGFYDELGDHARSLEILRRAYEGTPDSRAARLALTGRLRAIGEAAEAEAILREATRTDDVSNAAGAWVDLAAHREALGEYGASADAMERAVELARDAGDLDPQLAFEFADSLVLAERFDQALEVADGLTLPAHQALIRGRVAQERGDPAKALEEYDRAMALWPDNPWARYFAALAAEELGDFARALAEYRFAVRIDPGATDARTRGARQLFADGKPALAWQMLVTAAGQDPLDVEAQLLQIRLAGYLGDMKSVHDVLVAFESQYPRFAGRALREAVRGIAQRSGPEAALGVLTSAPVDYAQPHYALALHALVGYAHDTGKADEIREDLERTLASSPDSGASEAVRGYDLERSGAPVAEVRAVYERALELVPENPLALAGLARLALADDPGAAAELFDRAAAKDSLEPELKLAAAQAWLAAGSPAAARERLVALLKEYPHSAAAAAELVRLDLARGAPSDRTLDLARRAAGFGGGPDAFDLLSRVHEARGEPDAAARASERAEALRHTAARPPAGGDAVPDGETAGAEAADPS